MKIKNQTAPRLVFYARTSSKDGLILHLRVSDLCSMARFTFMHLFMVLPCYVPLRTYYGSLITSIRGSLYDR